MPDFDRSDGDDAAVVVAAGGNRISVPVIVPVCL